MLIARRDDRFSAPPAFFSVRHPEHGDVVVREARGLKLVDQWQKKAEPRSTWSKRTDFHSMITKPYYDVHSPS